MRVIFFIFHNQFYFIFPTALHKHMISMKISKCSLRAMSSLKWKFEKWKWFVIILKIIMRACMHIIWKPVFLLIYAVDWKKVQSWFKICIDAWTTYIYVQSATFTFFLLAFKRVWYNFALYICNWLVNVFRSSIRCVCFCSHGTNSGHFAKL